MELSRNTPTREPRQNRRMRVNFRRLESPRSRIGFSANVSPGGMFIIASQIEESGTPLELEVDLVSVTLRMRAVVVWSRFVPLELRPIGKMGFGVRLVEPPDLWTELIASR